MEILEAQTILFFPPAHHVGKENHQRQATLFKSQYKQTRFRRETEEEHRDSFKFIKIEQFSIAQQEIQSETWFFCSLLSTSLSFHILTDVM